MGLFDVIGGKPQQAPERGFDVGLKLAAIREANSPGAKLQGVMDAYQKGIEQRQNNQINETKARGAKILGILQEGMSFPPDDPRRQRAEQLASVISSNPDYMGSLGLKTSTTTQLTPEQKRGEKARYLEYSGAEKTNSSLGSAENSINQLDQLFKEAVPYLEKQGADALTKGFQKATNYMTGGNEKLRAYKDVASALSSSLSRGLFAERGVLTDKDREVAQRALPNEFDSVTTYNAKIKILRSIIDTAKKNFENKKYAYLNGMDFNPEDSGLESSSIGASSDIGNLTNDNLFKNL